MVVSLAPGGHHSNTFSLQPIAQEVVWQTVSLDAALPVHLFNQRGAAAAATTEGLLVLCGGMRDVLGSPPTAPLPSSKEAAIPEDQPLPIATTKVYT